MALSTPSFYVWSVSAVCTDSLCIKNASLSLWVMLDSSSMSCKLAHILCFFKNFSSAFKARITERVSQENKEIFHLLVYSPNGSNGEGWARRTPGARDSIWVSGHRGPSTSAIPTSFPDDLAGSELEVEQPRPKQAHDMGCQPHRQLLIPLRHNPQLCVCVCGFVDFHSDYNNLVWSTDLATLFSHPVINDLARNLLLLEQTSLF